MENEKRLIDANELAERFDKRIEWLRLDVHDKYSLGLYHGAATDKDLIAEIPTVDAVEVVHARWEDEYGGKYANPRYRCSACKEKSLYKFKKNGLDQWVEVQALTPYCPHCNAKMDADKETTP